MTRVINFLSCQAVSDNTGFDSQKYFEYYPVTLTVIFLFRYTEGSKALIYRKSQIHREVETESHGSYEKAGLP